MTTSTTALCSHNSSSSKLLVSLCFVYLEKSGHELQNGLCCTETFLAEPVYTYNAGYIG